MDCLVSGKSIINTPSPRSWGFFIGGKENNMAYKLAIKHATKSACYKDPRKMEGQLGVMLHSVGCSQPSADNWATRWNRLDAKVCATYALEPDYVVQVLPETKRPWTSGSGKNGNANNYMIQIEMGEPACLKYGSGGRFTVPADKLEEARKYVRGTYKTAVDLVADICNRHNIDPTAKIKGKRHLSVISHREGAKAGVASNHGDPEHLWSQLDLPYTMDTFRCDVATLLSTQPKPPTKETERKQVKIITPIGLNVRAKPTTLSKRLRTLAKGKVVEISDERSGWGYVPAEKGWINLSAKYVEEAKEQLYRVMVATEYRQVGAYRNYDYALADYNKRLKRGETVKIVEIEV